MFDFIFHANYLLAEWMNLFKNVMHVEINVKNGVQTLR